MAAYTEPSQRDNETTAFIHNLSPVKRSNNTSYFDMQVQTGQSEVKRGVCFSVSKHERFKEFSKSKSPVKLKNFNLKDDGSILMNNHTRIEKVDEDPGFQLLQLEKIQNIASLSAVNAGQLVSVKAKLVVR